MKVSELIEHLQTFPQDIYVGIKAYSEQCLLEKEWITLEEGCLPRADGWIQCKRPDKQVVSYCMFPGN